MTQERHGTTATRERPGRLARSGGTPRERSSRRPGGRPTAGAYRRRRTGPVTVAGVVVLAVALLTAFLWPGFARSEPEPQPTVSEAAPNPTLAPAGRPENQSAFLAAMPDAVLQVVVRGVQEHGAWVDDLDAVESWAVTYADSDAADAVSVRLVAGQWGTTEEAETVYDGLLEAAGDPTSTGDVTAGGETVGGYAVTPGDSADQSVVTWRNETTVLQAFGPTLLVQDFYMAYPL